MNARPKLTLDTNILVYAFDKDAGDKQTTALHIVDQAAEMDTVLTLQALCEFFAAVTRKQKMPAEEAHAQVEDWLVLFPVVAAKPPTLAKAMHESRRHGLSFWDALLWATATEAGVTILLSEDFQHGRTLEGVQIINPFQLDSPLEFLAS